MRALRVLFAVLVTVWYWLGHREEIQAELTAHQRAAYEDAVVRRLLEV